jgi:hypothetical protein
MRTILLPIQGSGKGQHHQHSQQGSLFLFTPLAGEILLCVKLTYGCSLLLVSCYGSCRQYFVQFALCL